ncbi:MAG: response regulator [Deltaproteobacteria bacterium]|nr:response regulator [Deltaproteobacteria bacterium]
MSDSRDKHQLAKITLRRRAAPAAPASPGAPRATGEPSGGGLDIDEAFDRSFDETFGPANSSSSSAPPPSAADSAPPPELPFASSVASAPPPSSLDLEVDVVGIDVAEPATEDAVEEDTGDRSEGTKAAFLRTLAADTGVPAVDLDRVTFDLSTLDLLPRDIAMRSLILPFAVRDDRLLVAVADPGQKRTLDELEFVSGLRLVPHVAPHSQLRRFLDACYRGRAAGDRTYAMPGAAPPERLEQAIVFAHGASPAAGDLARSPVTVLPIDLEAMGLPTPPVAAASESREPRPRRVLVVDDEADIRQLVVRVLRDRGFEVTEASHGAEALRMVQAQPPDLLVLDAMLPEIHGFDVCRRLKQSTRYAHIPVIMISAIYRGWRFATDLKKSYGVDHFMEKPFKIGELAEKVEQILSGAPAAAVAAREPSAQAQAELAAGIRKYRDGDLEGAVVHLVRGVDADPQSHQLHYQLGILYGRQGRIYQAIQELERALELEPGDFGTLRGLGQLYEHAGFPLKAVEMWERAANASTDEAARSSIKEHLLKLL